MLSKKTSMLGKMVAILLTITIIACSQQPKKILLILREGSVNLELMLTKEAIVMKDLLEKAGFQVEVATASGQPLIAGSVTIRPDRKLSEVKVGRYSGILMACMAAGPGSTAPETIKLVATAAEKGIPVAAQNGAVEGLSKAGLLKGKHYAFWLTDYFKEGIYEGKGVIQDGKIITSGSCPYSSGSQDTTTEITLKLISALKETRK